MWRGKGLSRDERRPGLEGQGVLLTAQTLECPCMECSVESKLLQDSIMDIVEFQEQE